MAEGQRATRRPTPERPPPRRRVHTAPVLPPPPPSHPRGPERHPWPPAPRNWPRLPYVAGHLAGRLAPTRTPPLPVGWDPAHPRRWTRRRGSNGLVSLPAFAFDSCSDRYGVPHPPFLPDPSESPCTHAQIDSWRRPLCIPSFSVADRAHLAQRVGASPDRAASRWSRAIELDSQLTRRCVDSRCCFT